MAAAAAWAVGRLCPPSNSFFIRYRSTAVPLSPSCSPRDRSATDGPSFKLRIIIIGCMSAIGRDVTVTASFSVDFSINEVSVIFFCYVSIRFYFSFKTAAVLPRDRVQNSLFLTSKHPGMITIIVVSFRHFGSNAFFFFFYYNMSDRRPPGPYLPTPIAFGFSTLRVLSRPGAA